MMFFNNWFWPDVVVRPAFSYMFITSKNKHMPASLSATTTIIGKTFTTTSFGFMPTGAIATSTSATAGT